MSHEYEKHFDATVVQYFCGRLAEPARVAFEAWLQEDLARVARVERLRVVWEVSAETSAGADAEAALAQVKQRIRARRDAGAATRPILKLEARFASTRRSWGGIVWRIAAVILVLVGVGLLWRSESSWPTSALRAPVIRSYATARGERAIVNLPDGSTVTLHNESTLDVPTDFGNGARDVRLRGEGYFEVTRDPSRPFHVRSGDAVVRVLGTKFGVRARVEDSAVQVAVLDGRVAVGFKADTGMPVLTAGQVARLRGPGRIAVQDGVDVRRLLSWTSGRLIFDRTPVPEVLAELSRWFDRDFVLGDSTLASLKLTTMLGGQSLAEAIAVLETALDVQATVDHRRIILLPS